MFPIEVTASQQQNKGPKFYERRGLGKALIEYKAAIKASYGLVSQDMHHVARTVWRRYITASADVLKTIPLSDHVLVGQIPQFARVSPKERISRIRHVIDTVEKCGLEPSIVLYEILISAHMGLKGGAEQCACVMDEAKEKGLIPLRSTYAFLLRVIAADRGYQSAWSFMEALELNPEAQVLSWKGVPSRSAEPYTMDTRSLNVFIRLNAEKGDVEGINAVLLEMAKRGLKNNSYTWSMRLYGHSRAGDIEGALRLWKEMDEQGVHKNKNVYQTMIFALLHEGSTRKRDSSPEYPQTRTKGVKSASDEDLGAIAMSIYRDMLSAGYTAGVVLYNIFMSSYLRQGKIPKVFELFQEMERKDIHPDVASYTTLMSAHIATEDPPAKVDEVFSQMVENGVEPDLVAFSTAMSAHAARGDSVAVERYFDEALRNGFPPNSYTYHIRIHAACQSRDMQRAISLVTEMESHGYEISEITYNTLIGGYGLIGDVQGAEEAFDYAQRNLPLLSHPRIYNCLLHAYVVNGCRKEAHQLYDEMIRRGVYPDQVTLNILIKMETQRGHAAGAQKVFDRLRHHGYVPDVYSLVPVMRMHALRGDIGGTKTVKKLLEDTGIGGTVGINVLMEGLWKNGDKEGCEREFMLAFAPALTKSDDQYRASTAGDDETSEMIADIRTFDILVRCFRDTPDLAHHFFRLCQKPPFSIKPDARLYNALIEAYARAGDKDGALEVFQEMKAQHVQGDIWTFTLLLKIGVGQNGKKAEFSDSEQETTERRVEERNMSNKHRQVVNGHSRDGNDESVDRPIVASAGCI
ncbi:hypothetical protein HDU85_006749 [Gaertneriomyces sp. JEL0708]|nr:hypothetical protein HDU85_006749 [Gaertneriomyces sp. JEL0708]